MNQPRDMLLDLAKAYGIGDEVAELIADKPDPQITGLGPLLLTARCQSGRTRHMLHTRTTLACSQLVSYEASQQKNPGIRTIALLARGYELPLWQVLCCALSDIRMPRSAPGAKPVRRRNRAA